MSKVFDAYAHYYDLLYREKDYQREAEYIVMHIRNQLPETKRILELGCGTGAHAEHLARKGYIVHGVDNSNEMLLRAEQRKNNLPENIASRLTFSHGDARFIRAQQTYDVVISLFHVLSYQASNADLASVFDTAALHLLPGGLFLFDFWYGPAVFSQKPAIRILRLGDDYIKVTRIAEPEMHTRENVVDVNYSMFIEDKKSGHVVQVNETHRMRYFFLPELDCFCVEKFNNLGSYTWMTNNPPDEESWSAFQVLKRL